MSRTKTVSALTFALLLTACGYATQTSSGRAFVEAERDGRTLAIDSDIRAAADVEPQLHFPARIGVARVINGALTVPTGQEADLLAEFAADNRALGQFVPVSPLVTTLAAPDRKGRRNSAQLIRDIRLGAARQHLDHVLIYEVGATGTTRNTALALADLTLVGGAFLPTRSLRAQGVAQAMLIDVRNGYPYGTAQTSVDLSGLSVSWGATARQERLRDRAVLKVVTGLMPEVEKMLRDLARDT